MRSRMISGMHRGLNRRGSRTRAGGQGAVHLKPEHEMRTFMCSGCGLMLKLPMRDWRHVRGSKIPEEHGCPRCIGKALREAYKKSPKRAHGSYESGKLIGMTTLQAEHGMQWIMDEERKAHGWAMLRERLARR